MSLVLSGTVLWWGLAGVVWHVVSGHAWGDAMTFMLVVGATMTVGQWLAALIRRKWGDLRGS
ncbi:hypothetical protein ACFWN1_25535 [Streptomyces sp. NPDC058459]|uniref:hypothetical protein n=1 Tax=Streptomyces sp. NPDC058459 TaxID=3346508 RepID=UPI00364E77FB